MLNRHSRECAQNPLLEILRSEGSHDLSFTGKSNSNLHEYYLVGEIEDPKKYAEWFDEIRHASQNDTIRIFINSPGGDLMTAIQFIRVIRDCPGTVVASVEGSCCSAATMIFLACSSWEVAQHSLFMFHAYSGGTFGKGGEMFDQLRHESKWFKTLVEEIYNDFLSPAEIEQMLNNKDIWMSGEDAVARLNHRAKIRMRQRSEQEEQVEKELAERLVAKHAKKSSKKKTTVPTT